MLVMCPGLCARTQLTVAQLQSRDALPLMDYRHYAVPAEAANPRHDFTGSLQLAITPGTLTERGTQLAGEYASPNTLPPFHFQFVQYGTHLLPVMRQVVNTGHPGWEWILSPGRVWQENGDGGFSRAALPFALQEVNANCTHNGVMTFVFKSDGKVSQVAYQIAQETCSYFKFDLHGKVPAVFTPGKVANGNAIKQAFHRERQARLPTRPLEQLAADYPHADIDRTKLGSDQSAEHMTAFGVLYNGVLYQGNCMTRSGNYPFCDDMALPAYSTAKTLVAGLGVMRLAQLYPGQQHASIASQVQECHGRQWQDVSVLNALDMATGNYRDEAGDEGSPQTINEFFLPASHSDKIRHSCGFPRQSSPGTTFAYHTSDSYLVARFLQQFYQQQLSTDGDFFNHWLVDDIYKPLGLSPLSYASKRTYDEQAQVWGGYGLTLTGQDFVKLGRFLAGSQGRIQGEQILAPQLLAEAMQQTAQRGLRVDNTARYQHSVWAFNWQSVDGEACEKPVWLPYLSGYGGIGVVPLSNGMVYYYVSDNQQYGFAATVQELAKLAPLCTKAKGNH